MFQMMGCAKSRMTANPEDLPDMPLIAFHGLRRCSDLVRMRLWPPSGSVPLPAGL